RDDIAGDRRRRGGRPRGAAADHHRRQAGHQPGNARAPHEQLLTHRKELMSSFHVLSGSFECTASPRSRSEGSPLTFRLEISVPSGMHSAGPPKPTSLYANTSTRPL